MNRYVMIDGAKSVDFPQYPNSAWNFYSEEPEQTEDFYASVAAVFRAVNLTANVMSSIPFALVTESGEDYDTSAKWENKVGFMPNPTELIRLWRMSLTMTNSAYGFLEHRKGGTNNLRYIVPKSIAPIVDVNGLKSFKRTLGTTMTEYMVGKSCPIFWLWRMDHTTELLPSKNTELRAMMAAAGVLYYADYFVESFFRRGGIKPTMLILKGMTTKDNIDKIEGIWDKVVRGYYKYLGKIFQGVDANGGLEALPIGEGVDTLKDQNLMNGKIADVAMATGIPLSLLLANSANYATAITECKFWFDNDITPYGRFMTEGMNELLFKPLRLRWEFRPEVTDPGQEDEVSRAGAYSTYVSAGMLPSIAAQIVGIELPQGVEYDDLDPDEEEMPTTDNETETSSVEDEQSSTDNEDEPIPAKFIPNLDQLHELELWRKFAFRKLKKGEDLDFPFEAKTIPEEMAGDIREKLVLANCQESIRDAFDCFEQDARNGIPYKPFAGFETNTKADFAILELADAINKAVEYDNASTTD